MLQEEERAVNRSQEQEEDKFEDLRLSLATKRIVIKGLLCCSLGIDRNCEGCPYEFFLDCHATLAKEALDVIRKLEQGEKLQVQRLGFKEMIKLAEESAEKFREMGERLKRIE